MRFSRDKNVREMRHWLVWTVDKETRLELIKNSDLPIKRIYGVNLITRNE